MMNEPTKYITSQTHGLEWARPLNTKTRTHIAYVIVKNYARFLDLLLHRNKCFSFILSLVLTFGVSVCVRALRNIWPSFAICRREKTERRQPGSETRFFPTKCLLIFEKAQQIYQINNFFSRSLSSLGFFSRDAISSQFEMCATKHRHTDFLGWKCSPTPCKCYENENLLQDDDERVL